MRFTLEQIFLTDARGQHSAGEPRYHIVEADEVDSALAAFLHASSATLVTVQK